MRHLLGGERENVTSISLEICPVVVGYEKGGVRADDQKGPSRVRLEAPPSFCLRRPRRWSVLEGLEGSQSAALVLLMAHFQASAVIGPVVQGTLVAAPLRMAMMASPR